MLPFFYSRRELRTLNKCGWKKKKTTLANCLFKHFAINRLVRDNVVQPNTNMLEPAIFSKFSAVNVKQKWMNKKWPWPTSLFKHFAINRLVHDSFVQPNTNMLEPATIFNFSRHELWLGNVFPFMTPKRNIANRIANCT
jgi:hypothetical protein